jgi:hypothetical protein
MQHKTKNYDINKIRAGIDNKLKHKFLSTSPSELITPEYLFEKWRNQTPVYYYGRNTRMEKRQILKTLENESVTDSEFPAVLIRLECIKQLKFDHLTRKNIRPDELVNANIVVESATNGRKYIAFNGSRITFFVDSNYKPKFYSISEIYIFK